MLRLLIRPSSERTTPFTYPRLIFPIRHDEGAVGGRIAVHDAEAKMRQMVDKRVEPASLAFLPFEASRNRSLNRCDFDCSAEAPQSGSTRAGFYHSGISVFLKGHTESFA